MAQATTAQQGDEREIAYQKKVRERFISETPSWYRGEMHLAFTLVVAGGTAIWCWTAIGNAILWEWLLIGTLFNGENREYTRSDLEHEAPTGDVGQAAETGG